MKYWWTIEKIGDSDAIELTCERWGLHLYGDFSYQEWWEVVKYEKDVTRFSTDLRGTEYDPLRRGISIYGSQTRRVTLLRDVWLNLDDTTKMGVAISLEEGKGIHLTPGIYRLLYHEDWTEEFQRSARQADEIATILRGDNLNVVIEHDRQLNSVEIRTDKGKIMLNDCGYEGWSFSWELAEGEHESDTPHQD